MTEGVRLQKVLAAAGVASRRACEVMISDGRVEVNGTVVTEQGLRVDPDRDVVRVDGSRIPPPRRHSYLVLNKPRGVVSTLSDPEGRRTLADFVADRRERLFHVGRLDTETEGLLILTNDGDFAHRLAHPSYEVPEDVPGRGRRCGEPGDDEATPRWSPPRRWAGEADFRQGDVHWRGPNSDQDHIARGSAAHRPPYDGCGRPPSAAPVADRHRARSARTLEGGRHAGSHPRGVGRASRPDQ